MPKKENAQALTDYTVRILKEEHRRLDVSDVLKHFVTEGSKQPLQFTAKEAAIPADIYDKSAPLLTELRFENHDTLNTAVAKQTWELFRKIGDAKFTRVGEPVAFPAMAQWVKGTPHPVATVTDVWEAEGGVRIELSAVSYVFPANGLTDTKVKFTATLGANAPGQ